MTKSAMKATLPLLTAVLVLATGCHITDDDHCYECTPPVPAGVWTITGDGYVEILWTEIHDSDVEGYRIYRSREAYGDYRRIGSSRDNYHVDDDVTNGVTYFYAVTAYDRWGHESDLSYETVHDTPRPAGYDLVVYDEDDLAGVDFSGYYDDMILPWDDPFADIFLLWLNGRYQMASTDILIGDNVYGTDLQDAGYVESLDDIDWAPAGGWSVETADTVALYAGHAYLVWTWENHFAKFRVTEIGYDYVVLDWAYQIDEGNPELIVLSAARETQIPALKHARWQGARERLSTERSARGDAPGAETPERR